MPTLQVGQRVALVTSTDPHTALRPGDLGTVAGPYDPLGGLPVDWDSGARLAMLPDEGDTVRVV
jgi:hypothetical protein